jgi:Ca2+:H+ antiporter
MAGPADLAYPRNQFNFALSMGEPPDEPSLSDRFRSWAKLHAKNGRASSKQAPILPNSEQPQISLRDGQRRSEGANKTTNDRNGIKTDIISDNSPTASPSAAPPPQDTEAHGEKSPAVEQNAQDEKTSIPTRVKNGMKRFGIHTKEAILHSWINVLLIFVPIGIAVNFAGLDPEIIFAMNAIAIVPLAGLLTHATESVASRLGDTLGALLNVSFGNAVEVIILYVFGQLGCVNHCMLTEIQYVRDTKLAQSKAVLKTCPSLKAVIFGLLPGHGVPHP